MTFLRSALSRPLRLALAALGVSLTMLATPVAAQSSIGAAFGNPLTPPTTTDTGSRGDTTVDPRALTGTQPITSPQLPAPIVNGPLPAAQRAPSAANAAIQQPPAAPPRPSEFQRFVQTATGRLLPVFGASFFGKPADTFTPVDNVPVSADYTVGPGDEIVVRAWGSIDIDFRAVVDRNGQISLPRIGTFSVAGVRAADLERHLREQIGRLYTGFKLNVSLGQMRGVRVFVVGPAQMPGVFTLSGQSTLLSAVVAAGGPAVNGSMRRISLRRDGQIVSELDMYSFLVRGDKSKDLQLRAGDVVVFHTVGPRVALNGEIDNAAIYELNAPEEPAGVVLSYAGGVPVLADHNRALLERVDPLRRGASRIVEDLALDPQGLATPLRDGDVLTLLPVSPGFSNAVTLTGHVAQPLRYPWFPGMRISDLIPSPEALISADYYRRRNVLVQVFQEPLPAGGAAAPAGPGAAVPAPGAAGAGIAAAPAGAVANAPGVAAPNPAGRASTGAGAPAAAAAQAVPLPVPGTTTGSRPRTLIQDVTGQAVDNNAPRLPTTLFDDLNWDYAVIERLNIKDLSTQIIPFSLGKVVLQHDQAANIELMPGDVVSIFGQNDFRVPVARQNRLVSLEGEVATPGVYQLLPGETMRQLIMRAGGFTPQAYVYGLEFSRESTRKRQAENLAAAMARLQTLAATQTAREAANQRDVPNAASMVSASSAATQAQLLRLSQVQPNGRIALELAPDVRSVDALPDIVLENADRIIVPPRPGFVTVVGAVANNNAFLWRENRTAGDYLRIAGPDEAADTSTMFILRADGTVQSPGESRGIFGRTTVDGVIMHPGDALIVPNQLDFETWGRAFTRNMKDWTQILANFGLGVAAINSLTD
ncbi:MAG: SLBB domain-containing protein [Burkholderiaceae bacterium]|nr:SLBB domain-containing protein [Burkholderiaceae bacterium]